jgi:hypothetical protein
MLPLDPFPLDPLPPELYPLEPLSPELFPFEPRSIGLGSTRSLGFGSTGEGSTIDSSADPSALQPAAATTSDPLKSDTSPTPIDQIRMFFAPDARPSTEPASVTPNEGLAPAGTKS